MIRAKFKCNSVTKFETSEKVDLNAVYGKDGFNATWAKYTPSGALSLTIDNPEAQGKFVPGREYILDVREANPDE